MANEARRHGNEGQARVCARRAAGAVAREYFQRRGLPVRRPSAYDLLTELQELPGLPAEAKRAAANLTLRVTGEFILPVEVDLLVEAGALARVLLGEADITL
ncbi:MAG TPA: hypothetical protein VGK00_13965 [Anaerolineales bacterium]